MSTIFHIADDFLFGFWDILFLLLLCFYVYVFRFSHKIRVPAAITAAFIYRCIYALLSSHTSFIKSNLFILNPDTDDTLLIGSVTESNTLTLLSMMIYCIIIIMIFTKYDRSLQILTVALFIPVCDMLRILGYYISRLFINLNEDLVFPVRSIFVLISIAIMADIFRRFFSFQLLHRQKLYWIAIGCLCLGINLTTFLIKSNFSNVSFIAFIFMVLLILVPFFFLFIENYNFRLQLEYQKQVEERDRQTILEIENSTYDLRHWHHEYKNKLMLLKLYCDEFKIDNAKELLNEMLEEVPTIQTYIQTGHPELDSIINFKFNEARGAGIDFRIQIAIPEDLPFDPEDLFSLLINLLNNAIEAAKQTESPFISLTMSEKKNFFVIQVENSCLDDNKNISENISLETTKKNKMLHGLGIPLIRSIAEKYNGTACFHSENGIFISKILLQLSNDQSIPATQCSDQTKKAEQS